MLIRLSIELVFGYSTQQLHNQSRRGSSLSANYFETSIEFWNTKVCFCSVRHPYHPVSIGTMHGSRHYENTYTYCESLLSLLHYAVNLLVHRSRCTIYLGRFVCVHFFTKSGIRFICGACAASNIRRRLRGNPQIHVNTVTISES